MNIELLAKETANHLYDDGWPDTLTCAHQIKLAINSALADKEKKITQLELDVLEIRRQSQQELNEFKNDDEVASLTKDKERMLMLAKLIWSTRWVSDEHDYQHLVGAAAEINSGNYTAIDNAIQNEKDKPK